MYPNRSRSPNGRSRSPCRSYSPKRGRTPAVINMQEVDIQLPQLSRFSVAASGSQCAVSKDDINLYMGASDCCGCNTQCCDVAMDCNLDCLPCFNFNTLVVANWLAFIFNVFLTALTNSEALYGQSIADISEKYITLSTPAPFTFTIWIVIYAFTVYFLIVQSLPAISTSDLLHRGVGWWFVVANILESLWGIAFCSDTKAGFIAAMIIITLTAAAYTMFFVSAWCYIRKLKNLYVWVAFFIPQVLHLAWLTAAGRLNVDTITVVYSGVDDLSANISTSIASFIIITLIALASFSAGTIFFTWVFLWYAIGLYAQLNDPPAYLLSRFNSDTVIINGFRGGALTLIITFALMIALAHPIKIFLHNYYARLKTIGAADNSNLML